MIDRELVDKKLNQIIEYVEELKPFIDQFSVEDILTDNFKYHTAERLFQLVVDTMVDINIHLIKNNSLGAPDDLQSTFLMLGKSKTLSSDFSFKIAPIVGLRNRIVHKYDSLNKSQFIEELKKNYPDFKEYLLEIKKYLG